MPVLRGIAAPTPGPSKKVVADLPPLALEDAQKYHKAFVAKRPVAGLLSGISRRHAWFRFLCAQVPS